MRAIDDVLVVGAGLAGMTLATALQKSGLLPEVIEIHPAFDVLGVGISVQPVEGEQGDEGVLGGRPEARSD